MKLSFAAALLGQTVPTLSNLYDGPIMARDGPLRLSTTKVLHDAPDSLILERDYVPQGLGYNRRLMPSIARNLKNTPRRLETTVPCDPKSTDADVGILSCGTEHTCEPSIKSSLGGVCTPLQSRNNNDDGASSQNVVEDSFHEKASLVKTHPSVTTTGTNGVQCDPASIEIGILGCEEGQFCKPDETSGLGGYCVDSFTIHRRHLARPKLENYLYQCEAPENSTYFCDCSDVNLTTGTGAMVCSQNATASYVQGCDEYVMYDFFTYVFNDSYLVVLHDCYETKTPFMEKLCFHRYFGDTELCHVDWNDKSCTSCTKENYGYFVVNCSNVDGGPVGDSPTELSSLFKFCSNTTCTNLCGEGSFIPDINFDINVTFGGYNGTCGMLAFLEENSGIDDAACPYYIAAAQSYCCVPLNSTITEGNSSIPGPEEEEDNSEMPDKDEGTSSDPPAEAGNEGNSGTQSLANIASATCHAAVVMALAAQV